MHIVPIAMTMGLLAVVSGCASLSYPLPKCDGYAKRPLNRSMWEWEGNKQPSTEQHSALGTDNLPAMAFTPAQGEPESQVAFAGFDEAGSHRVCRAG